ncbi:Protein STRUBBELIG-RECEPTOR FAMILY 5 [Capsicum annuum]|uniref:protein STRUBBELIG-RECEPTOR FAMILY 5 isoform X1 n=2 Tax=Capsicum annuum TaxID=4072 RepID=UPI0007BF3EF1|nr:protein STRUBBELIG-RECEPTOR FAMILY 5 isoform X1 [Capsicum annuum]KAF3634734.1 Protein STRUBBELIG-RECEPTOR FAMILY 5 [Capsicum annuum]
MMMMMISPCTFLCWIILTTPFTVHVVLSKTDPRQVSALNDMYQYLNPRDKLAGWKSNGGNPCDDSWKGITCSGSDVTEINLSGLGLTGSLGFQLDKLDKVTYFDVSKNNLKDNIPYQLPPHTQQLDLSGNQFTGTVPYSISQMADLKSLNLNRNKLSGSLSDIFGKLTKLTTMDLSYNSISGSLPQGLKSLSSLSKLHIQNNQFTGSIDVLADLSLDNLNVANNQFNGWIPDELKDIKHLETGGNRWSSGPAPPPPPGQKPHTRKSKKESGKSGLSKGAIAGILVGVLVVLGVIIALLSRRKRSSSTSSHFLEENKLSRRQPFTPLSSQELSSDVHAKMQEDFKDSSSATEKHLQTSSSMGLRRLNSERHKSFNKKEMANVPASDHLKAFNDKEFANPSNVKRSSSIKIPQYSLADLQNATGNFAGSSLLGEGLIGRVYKAKYPDGRVLAVKKIDSSFFQDGQRTEFTEVVNIMSKFHHANIVEVIGYCSEQGQNMLIFEYFRNGSLHEFLHVSDDFSKPLTWNTRVRIALGTARALEYLHEVCSPSYLHKNIRTSNIVLDAELNPHLCECGLAMFHERASKNLNAGYTAPECTKPSAYTLKSDVYSFGVVMLELLTGRKPFDSSKQRSEQYLVQWASPQLHDLDALERMADPALRGLYPPKSLSRFANVTALCVQSEPEFRPNMSEVARLVQRSNMSQRDDLSASRRTNDDDDDY